ncbi:acetate kinase [bacterium]|nr:acetate kinase [candidate division CSSED10-310 bacterium]
MMKILVINSGSSSVKFQVFEMENESNLCRGRIENIGPHQGKIIIKCKKRGRFVLDRPIPSHKEAIEIILQTITSNDFRILDSIDELGAVGHRVVHGGERFAGSCIVNDDMLAAMEACIDLAPLHNPPNIHGIRVCQEILPGVPQVGVFDTAFHQSMAPESFLYGIPYELYEKHGIRRYGFHGTSHIYCSQEAARLMNRPLETVKVITCHLGNGASIAAVDRGRSIDTSMGFTPLEGLVMGTRCGDLDPAIVPFLIEKEDLDHDGISQLLNVKSGVFGLAGIDSYDMRDILTAAEKGNRRADLAVRIYCHRIKKYIGAYMAELGGADCIVFTGGVGENNPVIRELAMADLDFMGIVLDHERNQTMPTELISRGSVHVFVISTNEELVIAREAKKLVVEARINQD